MQIVSYESVLDRAKDSLFDEIVAESCDGLIIWWIDQKMGILRRSVLEPEREEILVCNTFYESFYDEIGQWIIYCDGEPRFCEDGIL